MNYINEGFDYIYKYTLSARLVVAADNGDLNEIKDLLKKGADVNTRGVQGWTSLIWSSYISNTTGSIEIVKLLLKSGANVNAQNDLGNTSLIMASQYSNTSSSEETVKLLLDNGADPFIKNNDGEYPLDVCETEKCKELISNSMWKIMYGNVKLKSSKLKNKYISKDIWELILLKNKQKALCKDLSKPENKYILMGFANILNIPVNVNMNKRDLCTIISKQLSYGAKYGTGSASYMKRKENKEKILNIAKLLGINTNQPINKIMDVMALEIFDNKIFKHQ